MLTQPKNTGFLIDGFQCKLPWKSLPKRHRTFLVHLVFVTFPWKLSQLLFGERFLYYWIRNNWPYPAPTKYHRQARNWLPLSTGREKSGRTAERFWGLIPRRWCRPCLFLKVLSGTMAAIHPWWGCMYFNVVKENGRPHLLGAESVVRHWHPVRLPAQPLIERLMQVFCICFAGVWSLER